MQNAVRPQEKIQSCNILSHCPKGQILFLNTISVASYLFPYSNFSP